MRKCDHLGVTVLAEGLNHCSCVGEWLRERGGCSECLLMMIEVDPVRYGLKSFSNGRVLSV